MVLRIISSMFIVSSRIIMIRVISILIIIRVLVRVMIRRFIHVIRSILLMLYY